VKPVRKRRLPRRLTTTYAIVVLVGVLITLLYSSGMLDANTLKQILDFLAYLLSTQH